MSRTTGRARDWPRGALFPSILLMLAWTEAPAQEWTRFRGPNTPKPKRNKSPKPGGTLALRRRASPELTVVARTRTTTPFGGSDGLGTSPRETTWGEP